MATIRLKSDSNKLRYMSRDMVLGLFGSVLFAAGLVMLVIFFAGRFKVEQSIQQDADQYFAYLSKSLQSPVWDFNSQAVNQICNAFMTSEKFALLKVEVFWYGAGIQHIYSNIKSDEIDLVFRQGKLYYFNDEVIASLQIGLSKKSYLNELRRLLYSSLWITSIITMVMVLVSWLMLRRFVHHPLQHLMDLTFQIGQGNYDSQVAEIKHHEIALVHQQLIAMADQVKTRETSLAEANSKLKDEVERRKNSEEETNKLRNYLSNIIDSMPSVLVGVDTDGRITQWNKTVVQHTGITADLARGKLLSDLLPWMESETDRIKESIHNRQIYRETKRRRSTEKKRDKGENICYENLTIYPLITNKAEGAVIRIDDVTDQIKMEEVMIQSEKMLSIGGLAAGMAHEINNPLAGMIQTANIMKSRLQDLEVKANEKAAEEIGVSLTHIRDFMEVRGIFRMIDAICESGGRVVKIINNMLGFARKTDAMVSTHSPDKLMDQTLELAATDYDLKNQYDFKRIAIRKVYADHLPMLPCESSKIQQVLLNILRNGCQAMRTWANQTELPSFIIRIFVEADANMMRFEIQDNGPGMDEATRKKIFEPFFTTKPVGEGTGLGLSVSYFIIKENHGGTMEVVSTPGNGSTFIIRLPLDRQV